jgi:hypothetical protein
MAATPEPYWLVNSYGYPNPFSSSPHARTAWQTLLSFYDFDSYGSLKRHWARGRAGRRLSAHAVESWKATFEEFGVLYVLSDSDEITITPAGRQFRDAGESHDETEFAWIGLNALLRYPLRGGRAARSDAYADSDLLLYWFLYAAMRELGNYFWWSELERVLSKVFKRREATAAVTAVSGLRAGELSIQDLPLPVPTTKGAFYNSLNQVVVHGGMNYLTLGSARDEGLYANVERRHWILPDWVSLVDLALGGVDTTDGCTDMARILARMPAAPNFDGEEEAYFDYLGREVGPIPDLDQVTRLREVVFEGGTVAVLEVGSDYDAITNGEIHGPISSLCRLAAEQRVILSHDLEFSYIVEDKVREPSGSIAVAVRRARPISDPAPVLSVLASR